MKKERVTYIDALRIIAVFGVIIVHVSAVGIADYSLGSNVWLTGVIYGSLMRWCVPVFFMISGAMFLGSEIEYTFGIMTKKYIPRLLLCVVVWGIFYSLLDQFIYGNLSLKSLMIALWGVISNHTGYHLWFLYTLAMFYLMVPVLRAILTSFSKKQLEFLLVVWMVFSLGIGQVNELISELGMGLSEIEISFPVIEGYTGFFLLGYYLYKIELKKTTENILIAIGISSMIIGAVLNTYCSIGSNNLVEGFTYTLGISNCFVCIGIWLMIKRLTIYGTKGVANTIQRVAGNVFGVYLVHVFFNSLVFRIMKIPMDKISAGVGILIYGILILLCSYITTVLLKKIPLVRNIV